MIRPSELETRLLQLERRVRDHDQTHPATADHFVCAAIGELINLVGHVHDRAAQRTGDPMASQTMFRDELDPKLRALFEAVKPQLLVVLIQRLGGTVDIPTAEVDAAAPFAMALSVEDGVFHLEVRRTDQARAN